MTVPASPLAGANVRTLTARLCEVEAVLDVVGRLGASLRAELLERAIARWREDGAAPTFRADGLGSVSLSVPQTKVEITDVHAFTSWVAERHPDAATAQVVIAVPPDRLEQLLEEIPARLVDVMGPDAKVTAAVAVSEPFKKRLLETETVIADAGDRGSVVIDETTGAIVEGVTVKPGADPAVPDGPQPKSISVRLEQQAKADAAAQAQARLATVLEQGLSTALAADVRSLPVAGGNSDEDMPAMPDVADVHDLAAEGEPDDEPFDPDRCGRDGCGHPKAGHGGKTHTGRCGAVVPAASIAHGEHPPDAPAARDCECSRFVAPKAAAVAW